jgi:type VI protein secretion system component Hcp
MGKMEFADLHVTGYRFGGNNDRGEDVLLRWQQVTYSVAGGPEQVLDAPKEWGRQSMPECDAVTKSREPAGAPYDGFLKILGVPGSSVDKTHKGEIDIAGLCFGATNVDAATPRFTAFVIPKYSDLSTGPLFTSFGQGKTLGTTTITLQSRGLTPTEFLRIAVPESSVEGMVTSGSGLHDDIALGWRGGALTYTAGDTTSASVEITR